VSRSTDVWPIDQLETVSIAEPLQTDSMHKLLRPVWAKFGMRQWTSGICLQA